MAPAGVVTVGEFQVFPDRPLADLRSGMNMAYAAASLERAKGEFFALVCDRSSLPRIDNIPALRKVEPSGVLLPKAWGRADWPPTGRRHVIMVFDKPAGGRYAGSIEQVLKPLNEEDALRHFLEPVVPALRALHGANLVHGSVNPTNLMFEDAARRRLILGECVSSRTASLQPTFCTSLEPAMAVPAGRGPGQLGDDVFGLGATLVFLLLGRNPVAGIAEDELVRMRIEMGSYAAIIGSNRMPLAMIELLRGLLADDPKVRWTTNDIEQWLPARHVMTRQSAVLKRASRPFEFNGRSFVTARPLSHALGMNPDAAAAAIQSKEFDAWMQRALADETSLHLLKLARIEASGTGRAESSEASLVACVCIALDPLAAVHYRGLHAMVDGFGSLLATAFIKEEPIQAIVEAIVYRVPQFCLTARKSPTPEHITLLKLYEQVRLHLEDRRFGFGVERMLYELSPTLHCLSPILERDCVLSIDGILPALERHAADDFGGSFPIDRHCAAFVAAKLKSAPSEWVDNLSTSDPVMRLIGALRLLARLQPHGSDGVPNLARWIAKHAGPLVDAYHHRPTRKLLLDQLEKAEKDGRLLDLLFVVDDPERRERDEDAFAEAVRAHLAVTAELRRLASDTTRHNQRIGRLAGQLAAGFATIAAAAAMLASVIMLG